VTGGPVRFAPAASDGRVCLVSDDGYLYCLDARDGSLRWKFRGLPEGRRERKVLGNGRLISMWPARGGPVVAGGTVYFAAGILPSHGVFVHAIDLDSGRAVWSNTDSGNIPESNWDHDHASVAGISPQGYLAIVGSKLVVPCGPLLPAFFDLKTGKRHTYTTGWGGKHGQPRGSWFVAGAGKYLSTSDDLYDITRPSEEYSPVMRPQTKHPHTKLYAGGLMRLEEGRSRLNASGRMWLEVGRSRLSEPIMTPRVMYKSDRSIIARDLSGYELRRRRPPPRGRNYSENCWAVFKTIWTMTSKLDVHLKAGGRLYAGGQGGVAAIDVTGDQPKVVWQEKIEGTPTRMLAAAGKLFIVTAEGRILAYGASASGKPTDHKVRPAPPTAADKWTASRRASRSYGCTGRPRPRAWAGQRSPARGAREAIESARYRRGW